MSPVQQIATGRVESGAIDQRPDGRELVDAEGGLSWPSGVEDESFPQFLDKLAVLFATRLSATNATIDLDESQIEQDTRFIQSHNEVTTGLRNLVALRHAATIETRLDPARTEGFETFPRFRELVRVAEHGAIPHFKPGFQCNRRP
jgi:hypothetical protein